MSTLTTTYSNLGITIHHGSRLICYHTQAEANAYKSGVEFKRCQKGTGKGSVREVSGRFEVSGCFRRLRRVWRKTFSTRSEAMAFNQGLINEVV